MLQEILKEFGLKSVEKAIYVCLLKTGPVTAGKLAEKLQLPRPTVYDGLRKLVEIGLAVEFKQEQKKYFYIDNPKNLLGLFQDKIEKLQQEQANFEKKVLPELQRQDHFTTPRIKFYSGTEGLKTALNSLMRFSDKEVLLVWSLRHAARMFNDKFRSHFNRKRMQHGLAFRVLCPVADIAKDGCELKLLEEGGYKTATVRLLPTRKRVGVSYVLCEDQVIFLSSEKENFAFTVESQDFADLTRMQFEALWQTGKPASLPALAAAGNRIRR